ncbi:MAG: 3-isopropylmalate dehydratase small subunit [Sulfurospirillaceae bacterium]|nr:3-isopropylmalate dehydratase small subunit [Sulfurospirillaceae bacterium]MDD3463527.1 3-isopropylmalate dehydratase small subunit [Sulfurospirillaceae bacterium]
MKSISGKVWKFGDNIDTDLIIAARYLNTSDPQELAKHVMEDADPQFFSKMKAGDIIVAGENFGCGSSREHAPIALKAAGISAVVAKSFARIFYRNAFNTGLPIFELKETDEISEGSMLSIDMQSGKVDDAKTKKSYTFSPIPPFMQELLFCGGLMNYAKNEMSKKASV